MPFSIIRKYRLDRNYTQEYVARRMGISQNGYSKIENCSTHISIRHLKKIAQILEVSLLELLVNDLDIHVSSEPDLNSVTRENLVMAFEDLLQKAQKAEVPEEVVYPVVMSLFQLVDTSMAKI